MTRLGRRLSRGVVSASLLVALLLGASSARAQNAGADAIVLKDGSVLRGSLQEVVPGDHATITLSSGQSAVVKWSYVDRIDRNGVATTPGAATPTAPAPATGGAVILPAPAAPSPGAPAGLVHVHIDTDDPDATLEMSQNGWMPVCDAPCDKNLPIGASYRIAGSGIRESKPFTLGGSPGDKIILRVDTASRGGRIGGIVLLAVGGPVALVGAVVLLTVAVIKDISPNENTSSSEVTGWTMVGVGVAGIIAGAVLLGTNGKTHAEQRAVSARGGREPTWASPSSPYPGFTPARAASVSLPLLRF